MVDFKKIITYAASTAVLGASLYFFHPNPSTAEAQPKTHLGLEKIVTNQSNGLQNLEVQLDKFSYDLNPEIKREHIRNLSRSVVPMHVKMLYEDLKDAPDEKGARVQKKRNSRGTGILLNGDYVLSAAHVMNPITYIMANQGPTPEMLLREIAREPNVVLGKEYHLLETVLEGISPSFDFALMKFKKTPELKKNETYKYKLGKSSDLELSEFVYVVGNGHGDGVDFRRTSVTKTLDEEGFFCISMANIAPGDSGGYVFAIKNGIPELVGMLELAKYTPESPATPYGYARGIDPIIEKIKAYNPKIIDEWGLMK